METFVSEQEYIESAQPLDTAVASMPELCCCNSAGPALAREVAPEDREEHLEFFTEDQTECAKPVLPQ
eukprot:m51a1_g3415 hypothetical protein (68) ;mRNA; f:576663-576927